MAAYKQTMYISSGDTNGMYTLRMIVLEAVGNRVYSKDRYWKSLGRDWNEVYLKFLSEVDEQEKYSGHEVHIGTNPEDEFLLNEWGTGGTGKDKFGHAVLMSWKALIDSGIMPFGKYSNCRFADISSSYRNWVRKVCLDTISNTKNRAKERAYSILFDALEAFGIEDSKAEAAETAAKAAANTAQEALRAASKHLGSIGGKVSVKATCEALIPWQNAFGEGVIKVLRTDAGDVIKVFGKLNIVKGEVASITGKVKSHGEYKGQKETVLNYVKKEAA